jgi:hypothetical protein
MRGKATTAASVAFVLLAPLLASSSTTSRRISSHSSWQIHFDETGPKKPSVSLREEMPRPRASAQPPLSVRIAGGGRWRVSAMRGAHDLRLRAFCVSCDATARNWYERLHADGGADLRATLTADGRPVLRALFRDACDVCGGPELEIVTDAQGAGSSGRACDAHGGC